MMMYNRLTVTAACAVLSDYASHGDLALLENQWGIAGRTNSNSKSQRSADLARIAIDENPPVLTENGQMPLSVAVVEEAIKAPPIKQNSAYWLKLIAGLRFDGFDLDNVETEIHSPNTWATSSTKTEIVLRPIYPQIIPTLNFREAEDEVSALLKRFGFTTSHGHLNQAISAFSRGDWAASNAQLRTFFESYLQEIARACGSPSTEDAKATRKFLGALRPPFFLTDYNEWNETEQKPQFFSGMMARLHPEGSHPGLSETDDSAFRLHISLVCARLLLRRFDQRNSHRSD